MPCVHWVLPHNALHWPSNVIGRSLSVLDCNTFRFGIEKSALGRIPAAADVEEEEQSKEEVEEKARSEESVVTAELQLLETLLAGIRAPSRDSEHLSHR